MGASLVAQVVKNLPAMQEDPLEREWQPTPVFLPRKPHGSRSLVGYRQCGCKESDDWAANIFTLVHDTIQKESADTQ